jgi:putative oxidoreductase
MADLTLLREETHPRVNIGDWMIRLGVAIVFLIAGAEKFSATNPNSHWVSMFTRIGLGEWFRYFTGVVEVLGAALILIPRTVLIGVALLAVAMAGAAVIVFFVLGQRGESLFPALILIGLLALGWKHWNNPRVSKLG